MRKILFIFLALALFGGCSVPANAQGLPSAGLLANRPVACPQSALYYFAVDTLTLYVSSNPSPVSCTWLAAGSGTAPGPVFNITNYGGIGDLRTCNVTTNSTTTITAAGSNPCAFTSADVGRITWVMNPSTNAIICASSSVANSIVSQTTTTAILAHACTASLASTALAYIGTDNISATQALATALTNANGGVGFIPSGNYALGGPASGTVLAFNIPTTVTGSVSLKGNGETSSVFYPAPWFRTNENFGGELFNFDNQSAAVMQDFGINLSNYSKSGLAGLAIVAAEYPQADRLSITNAGTNVSPLFAADPGDNLSGFTFLPIPTWFNYGVVIANTASLYWEVQNGPSSTTPWNFDAVADVIGGGLQIQAEGTSGMVNVRSGVYSAGSGGDSIITLESSGSTPGLTLNVSGTQFCSNGVNNIPGLIAFATAPSGQINIDDSTFDSAACPTPGTNVTDFEADASGEIFSVKSSSAKANGTGYNFNLVSGSIAYNGLGNVYSGGTRTSTGSGVITSQSSEAGTITCSTSAATITFKGVYPKAPFFTIQDQTTTTLPVTKTSESATTLVVGCPGVSDVLNYTITPAL